MAHYCNINKELSDYIKKFVSKHWKGKTVRPLFAAGQWQYNRCIQISTPLANNDIHYEYCIERDWNGHVELHFEGRYGQKEYIRVLNYLKDQSNREKCLSWHSWGKLSNGRCRIDVDINSWVDITDSLKCLMDIFDPILEECKKLFNMDATDVSSMPYTDSLEYTDLEGLEEQVCLLTKSLQEVFSLNLVIPDYQRAYCWEDRHVTDLWKNLEEVQANTDYHLGAIILQRKIVGEQVEFNIIDGQQRLVTLTLMLRELGYKGQMPLLKQRFFSEDAKKHIANNKALIKEFAQKNLNQNLLELISKYLKFSVLVLNDGNLDLAYTFFSNQNSKGVPLSDYDLLKAHHLRYLAVEEQAEHLARQWNQLTLESDSNTIPYLERTLGVHLYRLRKWMRKRDYDENKKQRVKDEFSAAPMMASIPPFGEQFHFYEKIQGGAHFFAYTDHFVYIFKEFVATPQVCLLREHLMWESHWKYEDIIETLLFGYYIKFGQKYLSEALFCIAGILAQHRYTYRHALSYKIREFAKESEIIMMIDQASSPTFFLAEALVHIQISGLDQDEGISQRFYRCLQKIFIALNDFTDKTIKERKENEYGQ